MSGVLRSRSLDVTPEVGPLSERRTISVSGAAPGSLVTVRAVTRRDGGDWAAQATFLADRDGSVDASTQAPVSGDYRVVDAMGLFWSQRREPGTTGSAEPSDVDAPLRTTVTAWSEPGTGHLDVDDEGAVASQDSVEVVQWLRGEGVSRTEIRHDGLVGTLFRPALPGSLPTVIVLNGSGGGINEARAAQYASRGIQAFALGYFRAPGLSDHISRTPLEYFERALRYVATTLDPAGGRAVVSGQSRGGELSLLLAATYPELVLASVPFVPGAFVFGAQGAADPTEGWSGPTWTLGGEPLEHLWNGNSGVTWQPWNDEPPPTRHRDVYIDGLHDRRLARASRIPIENFAGPVLCVSGLDDRAWPSSMASRIVLDTLERHGHSAERLHLDYEDAGHGIALPHLPSTDIERTHPVSGVHYSNGGTPRGIAAASADSFEQVCAFIHRTAVQASADGRDIPRAEGR
ncbi:acyl-CoA thioesterase/BAAT N-terminal domain-containing protein [Microbacterium saperdae]|uniref:Dienelactone hydrolase n=1 Tax=Microbacterium saperdae TaxID=69368 RepID=A0A543BMJ3_9MICO|nr:acyl-CoA thioester hydrolase/BAAT C-terminal domain-containing protein [Microbacterium saperdae]TQL86042.1 dienelactone hydrolase [Microbacterium saperdae]GGM51036.1 palmitoyl-CoA hydrolase [Microbacterium saperdae]